MNSLTSKEKVIKALFTLLKKGEKNITGYKLAKAAGVDSSIVYRLINSN